MRYLLIITTLMFSSLSFATTTDQSVMKEIRTSLGLKQNPAQPEKVIFLGNMGKGSPCEVIVNNSKNSLVIELGKGSLYSEYVSFRLGESEWFRTKELYMTKTSGNIEAGSNLYVRNTPIKQRIVISQNGSELYFLVKNNNLKTSCFIRNY